MWTAFEAMVAIGLLIGAWTIIRDLAKAFAWIREMHAQRQEDEE